MKTENDKVKKLNEDDLVQVNGGLDKLSNGMKINSSADDSSGYQISERMRPQIFSSDNT